MSAVVDEKLAVVAQSKAIGAAAGDSPATGALRARAAELAEILPLPDSYKERPWKYVDVSSLDIAGYQPGAAAQNHADITALRERYGVPAGSLLVQENSGTIGAEPADGLTLVDFAQASGAAADLIEAKLASVVPMDRNKFTALHYAYLRGGVLLQVKPNAEIATPVRIIRDLQAAQLAAPHTLIVTGANSRVEVIEDFRSTDEAILVLPAVEVIPGPGSEVRYTALHRWGNQTRVFAEQHMVSERDSAFVATNVVTGGLLVKGHVESSLIGRGSSSELFGLFLGDGDQQIDFYTLQDHIGPDTRSDLLYKSALKARSRSAYYGLTRVGLGAHNADANQEDRNLLLSSDARADSDPVLEILTNNIIRCSHGATAGPVDDEQLFYLESRGIPHLVAEAMLVRAFLGQVLDRVPDAALRAELEAVVEAKLEGNA
ncbi:MAG TPA: Fe-S cluster assembly protein SufD [Tepidiformaceae bacterium]|nr:Fe-S cluster assembly protein SufD [Tepidiformaceae bacterium]